MIPIHKIWGRLGNQLFILAAHYARCRDSGEHFFVQDIKYFEKYQDEIKQMFSEGITPNSVDRVAIHRRLGDYRGNTFYVDLGHHDHQNLNENYYMRAMAEFPSDTQFTVFSDQIDVAKQEPMFQGEQFEFSERDELGDLNYMASHKGIIGANSSFSWWGAFLSGADKIIFPKDWFGDKNHDQYIGVPNTWKRL